MTRSEIAFRSRDYYYPSSVVHHFSYRQYDSFVPAAKRKKYTFFPGHRRRTPTNNRRLFKYFYFYKQEIFSGAVPLPGFSTISVDST